MMYHGCALALLCLLHAATPAAGFRPVGAGWRAARTRSTRAKRGEMPSSIDHVRRLSQKLDHFDGSNLARWEQRYWVNASFFEAGGDGPVFLCVGGESDPMDDDIVVSGGEHCATMIATAALHGALVVALEHRFYNPPDEYPVADLSVPNLRYLSSHQVVTSSSSSFFCRLPLLSYRRSLGAAASDAMASEASSPGTSACNERRRRGATARGERSIGAALHATNRPTHHKRSNPRGHRRSGTSRRFTPSSRRSSASRARTASSRGAARIPA